jgi:hypothetical protein
MPRQGKPLKRPARDVREKQAKDYTPDEFERDLLKVTRQLDRPASEHDPGSPKTSE